MKAAELRIGNWINESGEPNEVWSIEGQPLVDNLQSVNDCPESHITPIPLTEEWLKRFGFDSHKIQWDYKDGIYPNSYISGELYEGKLNIEVGSDEYIIGSCEFVHQLQNLYFALTGQELKLKA